MPQLRLNIGAPLLFGSLFCLACSSQPPNVTIIRAPAAASLPQVAVDRHDTVHLVYYGGSLTFGDLFHVTLLSDENSWSHPQRVNTTPSSVTGLGPTDGGQLTIGPDGNLHVAWFHRAPPQFFYSKSKHGTVFEPQIPLSNKIEEGVESGPTLDVGPEGHIYVFWHAGPVDDAHRRVYMVMSRDQGSTFTQPKAINPPTTGVCACCGLRAFADTHGSLFLAYRAARNNVGRAMRLLTSTDQGQAFDDRLIHQWDLPACPVSTTTMSGWSHDTVVAWETQGQVYLASTTQPEQTTVPPGLANFRRKNPAVAVNSKGDALLAWGDGPGFQSGGTLHWQLFDGDKRPYGPIDSTSIPIPTRSVPTASSRADESFLIVY